MKYPEGLKKGVPKLDLGARPLTPIEQIHDKRRNYYTVPTTVMEKLSKTSSAEKCFVERENSRKMQEMLLSYSYAIVTAKLQPGDI